MASAVCRRCPVRLTRCCLSGAWFPREDLCGSRRQLWPMQQCCATVPFLRFCGGYFGHNWELSGFRAWLVAYLSWTYRRGRLTQTAMLGLDCRADLSQCPPASSVTRAPIAGAASAGCEARDALVASWRLSSVLLAACRVARWSPSAEGRGEHEFGIRPF